MPKSPCIITLLTLTCLLMGCASIYHEGQDYLKAERYDDALRVFQKLLAKHPNAPEVLTLIGFTHYNAGKYDEAISFFQQAKNADEKYGKAYLYLGMAYERRALC
ncbi:tetratricopeptide repeat protein [Candidatus Poribacteria bacterium]|nr:tetratricopeptide repeat protein [Candidatus Poribacteria bacterium]